MANTPNSFRQGASLLASSFGVGFIEWLDAKLRIFQHYRFCFLFVLGANVNEEVVATYKVSGTWTDLAWSVDCGRTSPGASISKGMCSCSSRAKMRFASRGSNRPRTSCPGCSVPYNSSSLGSGNQRGVIASNENSNQFSGLIK